MRIAKGVILALTIALASGPSWAQGGWYLNQTTFYSDASKTTVVGSERLTCNYEVVKKGIETAYYDVSYGFCP